MKARNITGSSGLLCLVGLAAAVLWPAIVSAAEKNALRPTGSWYLALSAEPFGLPPGSNLAGLATFHRDRTFLIQDAGDFGGLPFGTVDSAQIGSWRRKGGRVEAVSLFLHADAVTGDVLSWQKVHFVIVADGRDRMVATANVFELPCDLPAPFPAFGCPDPIESAADFTPVPPFDLPVVLKRLSARFDLPE